MSEDIQTPVEVPIPQAPVNPLMRPFKKKLCILGMAPSWREAPFDKPEEYEIWALNDMWKVSKEMPAFRADRWFEIHDLSTPSKSDPKHRAFLQSLRIPVYTYKHYADIPCSVAFPFDDITDALRAMGYSGSHYFTNQVTWMLAYALMMGDFEEVMVNGVARRVYVPAYEQIDVYGVDMAASGEYQAQRPSCEYIIGVMEGLGCKVFIPQTSDLLKATQLYAKESSNKNRVWMKTQMAELQKKQAIFAQQEVLLEHQILQARIAQAKTSGAASAYNEILIRTQ
jgi:hypothetical protein